MLMHSLLFTLLPPKSLPLDVSMWLLSVSVSSRFSPSLPLFFPPLPPLPPMLSLQGSGESSLSRAIAASSAAICELNEEQDILPRPEGPVDPILILLTPTPALPGVVLPLATDMLLLMPAPRIDGFGCCTVPTTVEAIGPAVDGVVVVDPPPFIAL
uniref:Putative secreted protein n=1 Tax=Anopheles triannulatus TaxID=58253 RepID=A0A2M4B1W1_9DIPT